MCYNVIDGREYFIKCIQKTGENNFDKLWVNNSGHNEGTICLVHKPVNCSLAWGWFFEHGHMNG